MGFVKNAWYCAAWSESLTDTPLHRKFLGEEIVLYRRASREPVALGNVCPHRFAPLHKGQLKDDAIECPYHGLRFGPSGACVHNPHGDGRIPQAAKVKSYPLLERNGIVWIWMGEPEKADPARLLDSRYTAFMKDREHFAVGTGDLKVQANYLLVMDNLLDLTHAPFVHPTTVGGRPEDSVGSGGMKVGFEEDERSVTSTYFVPDMPPTPQLKPLYPLSAGDFRIFMRWEPTSNLAMQLSMTRPGQPDGSGVVLPMLHLLTPIDDVNTHYFFALARNVAIDSPEAQAGMMEFARKAFEEEDEPMIAACQKQMGTTDLFSLKPVLLQTDVATVKARRRVDILLRQDVST
jgi:phenylpropionate dioxygenase-like ring-hydroxylating dioxygenase large terminal subunit